MRKRRPRRHVSRLGRLALLLAVSVLAGCGGASAESTVGEIAYTVDTGKPGGRIVVVRDDGSGARRVAAAHRRTSAFFPVWSPDGTKIAFTRHPPEGFTSGHVFVVNADGTDERQMGPGGDPQWTRDGTALLVEQRRAIYSVSLDGSARRLVVKGTGAALSHDGSKLAFLRYKVVSDDYGCCITDTSALFTVSLDGGRPRRLASTSGGDAGYHFRDPVWLAGDREIAVLAKHDFSGDASVKTVSEDGRQRVIADGVGDDFEWSPQGDRVAYSGDSSILYVARGDGSVPRAFDQAAVTPSSPFGIRWSPDGEKIAFYVDAPGDLENVQDIYVLDADDGDRRRIGRVRGYGVYLAWRPARD
jgi:Tol biopolymer transport system component